MPTPRTVTETLMNSVKGNKLHEDNKKNTHLNASRGICADVMKVAYDKTN